MELRWYRQSLALRHRWTTAHGSTTRKETLVVSVRDGDIEGFGEATPVSYHGQSLASAEAALSRAREVFDRLAPGAPDAGGWLYHPAVWDEFREAFSGQNAAASALDVALWDLFAKHARAPLHTLLHDAPPTRAPRTGLSIGMGDPDDMAARAREAANAGFIAIKVKVGRPDADEDLAAVSSVRAGAPRCALRIDANGGYASERDAIARIEALSRFGIEVCEQPLGPGNLQAISRVRDGLGERASGCALILDEDCVGPGDVARCAPACDGVNIKLSKCGGITPALGMIREARERGLRVMLGCMVESSLGIAAAAHLAPLADLLDLDGHLLLENDPWTGLSDNALPAGTLVIDRAPGLGVLPRS